MSRLFVWFMRLMVRLAFVLDPNPQTAAVLAMFELQNEQT